jgi:Putative phage tail protein
LLEALPVELNVRDGGLRLRDIGALAEDAAPVIVSVAENSKTFEQPHQSIASAGKIPSVIVLRYYDRDRDYQAGMQRSESCNAARNVLQIELPAVLDAVRARQIVEHKNLEAQYSRAAWTGNLAISPYALCAGDYFFDDAGSKWKIDEVEHRLGTAAIKARAAVAIVPDGGGKGMPGRHLPPPDVAIGETRMALIDLPIFDSVDPGKLLIAVFAAGTEVGWKRAAISLRTDVGLVDIGSTSPPATMGVTLNALGVHTPLLIDDSAHLDIEMLNGSMDIANRDSSPLATDAPHFWIAGEYIRVGKVVAIGNGVYRLARFLRGRFSPDMDVPGHAAGQQIVMVEPDSARIITEHAYSRGQVAEVEAIGLGDQLPVVATTVVVGLAITPLAPVHGAARAGADGSIELMWKRRSRIDVGWVDGIDQAVGEDREAYLVALFADDVLAAQWTVSESALLIQYAEIAALNLPENAALSCSVRQIGRFAQSGSLDIIIP